MSDKLRATVGLSPDGARRVYGQGQTQSDSIREALAAARDYLKSRPDCGPLSEWTFRNATTADLAAVQFARDV